MDTRAFNFASDANVEDAAVRRGRHPSPTLLTVTVCHSSPRPSSLAPRHLPLQACLYRIPGCMFKGASNYKPDANVDDGSCVVWSPPPTPPPPALPAPPTPPPSLPSLPPPPSAPMGCLNSLAKNYRSWAVLDDGSCVIGGCTDSRFAQFIPPRESTARAFNPAASYDDGSCPTVHAGCTDSHAVNYRPLANVDDGSCRRAGCMVSAAPNYDASAMLPGRCHAFIIGCMDSSAASFLPLADRHRADTCVYGGCTNSNAANFDPTVGFDDGRCAAFFLGCTDSTGECLEIQTLVP